MQTSKDDKIHQPNTTTSFSQYPNPLDLAETENLCRDLPVTVSDSIDPVNTDCDPDNQSASCGKPNPLPDVQRDQRILYIGAGPDADCCLLAEQVGPAGLVTSIVSAPHAPIDDYPNLIFLVASSSELPLIDNDMDWVVSNQPLNLAGQNNPDGREFMRILKPGGRISAPVMLADTELGSLWSPRLEAIKLHSPSVAKDVQVEPAKQEDLHSIQNLLAQENFPTDVEPHLHNFVVARHSGRVIGCGGMEAYGRYAVLRSLTVEPAYRLCSLGEQIRVATHEIAIQRGVARAYLMTTTIVHLFEKWGYQRIDRSQVPQVILETSEFQQDRCASATILCWDFSADSSEAS